MRSTSTTLLSFYFQQNFRGFLINLYCLFDGSTSVVSLLKIKCMSLIFRANLVCENYFIISIRLLPQIILPFFKDSKRKEVQVICLELP